LTFFDLDKIFFLAIIENVKGQRKSKSKMRQLDKLEFVGITNLASHSEQSDRVVAGFHACIVTLSETKGLVVEILRRYTPQNDISFTIATQFRNSAF
jgi:hypothetical protein